MAGEGSVLLGVDVLDVRQDEIRDPHELDKGVEEGRRAGEGGKRAVQAGVDVALVRLGEELQHELGLQQRLATAHGDAALGAPVAAVALRLVEKVVRARLAALVQGPGVDVVAVAAAHGTALQEDEEAHARAVGRAKRFCRVNSAQHLQRPLASEKLQYRRKSTCWSWDVP